jgi:hypothetical protein
MANALSEILLYSCTAAIVKRIVIAAASSISPSERGSFGGSLWTSNER